MPLSHQRWRKHLPITTPSRATKHDPRTDGDVIGVLARIKRGDDASKEIKTLNPRGRRIASLSLAHKNNVHLTAKEFNDATHNLSEETLLDIWKGNERPTLRATGTEVTPQLLASGICPEVLKTESGKAQHYNVLLHFTKVYNPRATLHVQNTLKSYDDELLFKAMCNNIRVYSAILNKRGMQFSFQPLPIIPDSVVEDRMVTDRVNSMKLSKNCAGNWWISFSGKDKADEARYNMIRDYGVGAKRIVINLYIKNATIFTPAQKEQLFEYVKKTSHDELIEALAVEDLTKLWCISTTSTTVPCTTTPKDGSDQTASTPKRSNKKSDRSVFAHNVSPVVLLKKDVNDTTQINDLTDEAPHTNSDGGREQGPRTFEDQLADEYANDTIQTNYEPKQGILLSTNNKHFRLGLWTAFRRFDQTAKTDTDKHSIVSKLMRYLQSTSFMEKIQFFKLTKSHTNRLPVEITRREAEQEIQRRLDEYDEDLFYPTSVTDLTDDEASGDDSD